VGDCLEGARVGNLAIAFDPIGLATTAVMSALSWVFGTSMFCTLEKSIAPDIRERCRAKLE